MAVHLQLTVCHTGDTSSVDVKHSHNDLTIDEIILIFKRISSVNFENCDRNIDLICAEEASNYNLLILSNVIILVFNFVACKII
jgi:hypothetical protein